MQYIVKPKSSPKCESQIQVQVALYGKSYYDVIVYSLLGVAVCLKDESILWNSQSGGCGGGHGPIRVEAASSSRMLISGHGPWPGTIRAVGW